MNELTPEQIQALSEEFENLQEVLKAAGVDVDRFASKSIKSVDERFKRISDTVKKSDGSYRDVISQLNDLADAIEESTDELDTQAKKQSARDRLQFIAERARNQKLMDLTSEVAGVALKTLFNYQFNQVKTGMRAVMNQSTSAFQMASDLQTQGMRDIDAGVQSAAGAATAVGTSLMLIPTPATVAAGAILAFGGALTSFVSSKYTEYFSERTKILADATESAYNSFREAAGAGALFAGGVTQLRKVALNAGLSQEQFTKIISDNRDLLAQAGYGVTDGARLVANVTARFTTDVGKSGQKLRKEMQNLGFSIEDQVAIAAEVSATMKRLKPGALDTEMAQATVEYAKNLRLIAEITGDDAKKRMDQARAVTDSYSFQSKFLREHNNDYAALIKVQTSLAKMEAHERRAVHQMYIRGATTDVGAIIAGFRDPAMNIANVLHQQNFTAEQLDGILYKYRDTLLTEDRTRKEAIASSFDMIGANQDAANAINTSFTAALRGNSDAYNRAKRAVEGAVNPQDEFTDKLNEATDELQKLRIAVQKDLTGAIKKFASEVPDIIKDFRAKLVKIGLLEAPLPAGIKEITKTPEEIAGKQGIWESDENYRKRIERARNRVTKYNEQVKDTKGKANGGIASGPLSGYMEVLHGKEAVVPLPDGNTIPVTIKQEGSDQVAKVLQELLTEVKTGNNVTQTSLKELVRAAKDNVTYTARVAVNTH